VVLEWHNKAVRIPGNITKAATCSACRKTGQQGRGLVYGYLFRAGPAGIRHCQQENEYLKQMNASPTAALLDPQGEVGRLYSAKTTPHMFIINPAGVLIYDGAIDDKATTEQATSQEQKTTSLRRWRKLPLAN